MSHVLQKTYLGFIRVRSKNSNVVRMRIPDYQPHPLPCFHTSKFPAIVVRYTRDMIYSECCYAVALLTCTVLQLATEFLSTTLSLHHKSVLQREANCLMHSSVLQLSDPASSSCSTALDISGLLILEGGGKGKKRELNIQMHVHSAADLTSQAWHATMFY